MVSNGEQGPPLTKRQAQSNRRRKKTQDYRDLRAWSRDAGAQAQKAGTNSMWGRMLGSGGGMALLWALGTATGLGIPALMYAAAAGAGSYIGSKKGEENVGGYKTDPLEGNLFYRDSEEDIIADMDLLQDKADTSRVKNAGIDALTAYLSVGGNIPGLKGANKPFTELSSKAVKGGEGVRVATELGGTQILSQPISQTASFQASNPFMQIFANLTDKATAPSLMNILKAKGTLSAIQQPFSIYNQDDA